ncbi:MAG: DUF5686 family protein [Bacteroidales bacterium]
MPFQTQAQELLTGRVIDAVSGKPLAFVNVVLDDGKRGTSTDIDGRFSLKKQKENKKLTFSYLGYKTQELSMQNYRPGLTIRLVPTEIELREVTILPGENPALRIIRKALEQRDKNNYENLPAFTYEAYEKMIFRASIDSTPLPDSLLTDTNEIRLRKFFDEKHLFMIENYYVRKHLKPGGDKQEVKATRVSGLKDPIFVFLISQLQSTTFYNDVISIGGKNYINPLTPGSISRYFYQMHDTLVENGDTLYSIFYRPWKGTKFDGLKGILTISTRGWAIASVTAEPFERPEGIGIRIQQLYQADSHGVWFPLQLNTDLVFNTVEIAAGKGKDTRRYYVTASGRSYIRNVNLNPDFSTHELGRIALEVKPDAATRDESYWNMVRITPLDKHEEATYRFIDSIGQKQNLDRIAFVIDALMKGKLAWHKVSIDLQRMLRYNSHEGFYLGMGLETNERFSQWWQAGAWGGYGFKDGQAKYGGFLKLTLDRYQEFYLHYNYRHEKIENGALEYPGRNLSLFDPSSFRDLMITRMDMNDEHRLGFSVRTLSYATLRLETFKSTYTPAFQYAFIQGTNDTLTQFATGGFSATLRWAYGEKFIQTTRGQMSLGTNYPVVWITLSKGVKNWLSGQFDFMRAGLDVQYSFFTPFVGKTLVMASAGITGKDLPTSLLFNNRAARGNLTLFSPGSLATMRMNEFYSDRFTSLWISHNFQNLLFKGKKFRPEPEIYTAFLWGKLTRPELHQHVVIQSPDKGYLETGLNLHRLLDLKLYHLGLGAAWRWGAYHLPKASDNLTLMMTLNFYL